MKNNLIGEFVQLNGSDKETGPIYQIRGTYLDNTGAFHLLLANIASGKTIQTEWDSVSVYRDSVHRYRTIPSAAPYVA